MSNGQYDLRAIAHHAMVEAGFHPDFPPEVLREAQASKPLSTTGNGIQDLRGLLWSSIDNDSSRDLDQIEYVEKLADGSFRLLVGIADVDDMVPKNSVTDRQAADQTTSVYTGVVTFPMLPDALSTDRSSLLDEQERLAVIIELHVDGDQQVHCHGVSRAMVRNRAKLAYRSTGDWLEGKGPIPAPARVPGLDAQLRLQLETSDRLRGVRKQRGLLTFGSIEPSAVVENGQVKDLTVEEHGAASNLIESFMVAANITMAKYLREKGCLSLRRVVRVPRRWDRIQAIAATYGTKLPDLPDPKPLADFLDQRKAADPEHFADLSLSIVKLLGPGEYIVEAPGEEHEGHFGLAAQDYTHSTAPNRRYADLVVQRLLKASLAGPGCPYTQTELTGVAAHCTEREDAARKVERRMRKVVAASFLNQRIGEVFDGIITGASPKGTYARLLKFPAEGMLVRGAQGVDVGDRVRVKLLDVNVPKGFIDFARV